jgi:hypothetical protein
MVPRPTPSAPGEFGHGDVPGLIPCSGQGDLGWGELGGPAAHAAAGPRGRPAHRRPLGDQFPLELGQRGEDVEDQPAGAGGGIDPLMQGRERHPALGQRIDSPFLAPRAGGQRV